MYMRTIHAGSLTRTCHNSVDTLVQSRKRRLLTQIVCSQWPEHAHSNFKDFLTV